MQIDRWKKIEEIFNQASTLPLSQRRQYVEELCADDQALCAEILALINADNENVNFLDEPVFSLGLRAFEHDELRFKETEFASYRIQKTLGRGGMGVVYLAEDLRLGRAVALKILPETVGKDAEGVRRFRQEARTASSISHPNITHIYEFGEEDGKYFLAMEYVEGQTLRELLREKKLSPSQVLDITLQIAEALLATHKRGIIHRDIKPENIIVTDGGLVKVLDFGVAKLLDFQPANHFSASAQTSFVNTTPGLVMGTISYISPEQMQGGRFDFRADIWSLGIVFYEMLTGRRPFEAQSPSALKKAILTEEPSLDLIPFFNSREETLLKNFINKILHKDLSKRFGSVEELVKELKILKQSLNFGQESTNSETTEAIVSRHTRGNTDSGLLVFLTKTKEFGRLHNSASKIALITALVFLTFGIGTFAWYLKRQNAETRQLSETFPKINYLTQDGRIKDAAISKDARLLAYVPIEGGKQSLWIRDLEQGKDWQLIAPDFIRCWGMRFTPDGESLLYIASELEGSTYELYRISVKDGFRQKIASNVSEPPAIAPDGKRIAFIRSNSAESRDALFIANIDGTEEKEISSRNYPETFSPSSISWSADGNSIVLGVGRNNNTESAIAAIPVNGGTPVELTSWKWAAVGGVGWESDNQGIVFSAREIGSRSLRIWRLSFADNQIQSLTDADNAFEEVTLSETENTLLTNRTYEVSDIWSVNTAGEARRLTTQGKDGADGLAVSSAGRVIFTQGEYEQSFLWSMNTNGEDRKLLTKNNGFLPAVSKDGRFIAYVSTEGKVHHIWLMEADGQNNRQITNGYGENYPSFTPDGNWIVYTVIGKERNILWKIPAGGEGKPIQITREGFTIKPQVSPDGTMIACTYRKNASDVWKIVVIPFSGGAPVKTFDLPAPRYQMIRWTPDNRALIFLDKRNGIHNLWRQPLDGSPPKQITNFSEDQILHQDLTADGSEYILSRGGRRRDIALIKNYK